MTTKNAKIFPLTFCQKAKEKAAFWLRSHWMGNAAVFVGSSTKDSNAGSHRHFVRIFYFYFFLLKRKSTSTFFWVCCQVKTSQIRRGAAASRQCNKEKCKAIIFQYFKKQPIFCSFFFFQIYFGFQFLSDSLEASMVAMIFLQRMHHAYHKLSFVFGCIWLWCSFCWYLELWLLLHAMKLQRGMYNLCFWWTHCT